MDDIRAPVAEGRGYRYGVYRPLVESITLHPVRLAVYGLWIASLVWFAWATLVPRRQEASC